MRSRSRRGIAGARGVQALISPSPGLNAVLTPACAVPISGGRRRGLAVLLRGLVLAAWFALPA
ncbi:MAG: hypothetical protein F4101_08690, partial [Nitrospira sp. SB0673_bin_12]|nr:hypothetical protein [Nitrospira sp. SB0673_bin_12]